MRRGRFTLIFMAPPGQEECPVELTYNWDGDDGLPSDSRHFGHLAYRVDNIYELCQHLMDNGVTINAAPARRLDGLCPVPRQHLGRAAPEGRGAGPRRALGLDAQYGPLVRAAPPFRRRCWPHPPPRRRISAASRCSWR
jgi:catechol 2,3-dioxygenase-like lactoylglutathione lyase family enzyme